MLHRWTLHPKRSSYDFFVWTDFGPIFPWSVLPLSWIVVDSLCSVFGEADEHGFGPLQRSGDSRDKRKGCKAVVARRGVTGEEPAPASGDDMADQSGETMASVADS